MYPKDYLFSTSVKNIIIGNFTLRQVKLSISSFSSQFNTNNFIYQQRLPTELLFNSLRNSLLGKVNINSESRGVSRTLVDSRFLGEIQERRPEKLLEHALQTLANSGECPC